MKNYTFNMNVSSFSGLIRIALLIFPGVAFLHYSISDMPAEPELIKVIMKKSLCSE
jgi:hypothetical protein